MALEVARAHVTIGVNDKPLKTGLTRTKSLMIGAIGGAAAAAGAMIAARLGGALVGLTGSVVTTVVQFQKGMNRVQALTQANEVQFKALNDQAKHLGSTTAFSASEAAAGMGFLAQAGFKVNDIIASMPGVLALASAGQLDLATTADIASNIMTGMGISASEFGPVADLLAKASATANTDIRQLGGAFAAVGPIGKASGQSLASLAASIQSMSDAGIQGEAAGTALRNILLRLQNPVGDAKKRLNEMGIAVSDSEGNMLPLSSIIGQIATKTKTMGGVQRSATLAQIAGTKAAAGFNVLLNTGKSALDEMTISLQDNQNFAQNMADTQMQGLPGAFKLLESAMEGAKIAIGETFASALSDAIRYLADFVSYAGNEGPAALMSFIENNKETALAVAELSAKLLGATAVFGGILIGIAAIANPFGIAIMLFMALGAGFVAFGGTADELNDKLDQFGLGFLDAIDDMIDKWIELQQEIARGIANSPKLRKLFGIEDDFENAAESKKNVDARTRLEGAGQFENYQNNWYRMKKAGTLPDSAPQHAPMSRGEWDIDQQKSGLSKQFGLEGTGSSVGEELTRMQDRQTKDREKEPRLREKIQGMGNLFDFKTPDMPEFKMPGTGFSDKTFAETVAETKMGRMATLEEALVDPDMSDNKKSKSAAFTGVEQLAKSIQQGLGNDPAVAAAKKTADATKKTADNTQKIADALPLQGPAQFGE